MSWNLLIHNDGEPLGDIANVTSKFNAAFRELEWDSPVGAGLPDHSIRLELTEEDRRLIEERDKGVAILLISTELEEVRKLSDRIMVLYEGAIVGEATAHTDVAEIGLMMAGALHRKEAVAAQTA